MYRVSVFVTPKQGNVTDAANPNGGANNVAGIVNDAGSVLGGAAGRGIFEAMIQHVREV